MPNARECEICPKTLSNGSASLWERPGYTQSLVAEISFAWETEFLYFSAQSEAVECLDDKIYANFENDFDLATSLSHSDTCQEEKVDLAWSHPAHEQVQATKSCIEMGTTWQEEEGEANGDLEKDHGRGDAGEDLERDRLDGPRPECLEETCWRPMLRPEPRGLSK